MQTLWDELEILVNGAPVHYYRTIPGAPGKPVLVLQHGFSDNGLCWAPVAEELAAEYDIIMPDARGHGHSARVQPGDQIDQPAELAALLDALGVEQAIVAGHSMGAQMAGALAARYPQLVRALVLEDPPWFLPDPNRPAFTPARMTDSPMGHWMMELKQKPFEQIVAEMRQEHPTWPDAYLLAWCQGKVDLDVGFLQAENRRDDWLEYIDRIACPTLLITADPAAGGIVSAEGAALAQQKNPNVMVVNFPGVGHHIRFAAHEEYMHVLREFLSTLA